MPLLMAGGLDYMAFKGVFQPKPFHDSVIPNTAVQEVVISNRFKAALLEKGRGATCSPWQLPMCGVFEMLLFPWCSVQLHQTSLFFSCRAFKGAAQWFL